MTRVRSGPLSGIRVLEVGHILAGPFGGMLLADLGADVIKIEPLEGDLSRQVGSQVVGEHNVYFASLNRNKRSVFIDLTTEQGQAQLGALAQTAHALLVNLRPSTIRSLGLDYESLRRVNPKIVCVALTGYGQTEDRRRVVDAGFNTHLVKPVQYAQLLRALADAGDFASRATYER